MKPFQLTALILSTVLVASPAVRQPSYSVTYSGGSVPTLKGGQGLHLFLDGDAIRLYGGNGYRDGGAPELSLKASSITEITYGQEVHHRVGTGVAVAVVFSLGIGMMVAQSKSKKHYIGIRWDDGETKGGLVLQADKNEFRGILAGLEGITGKRTNTSGLRRGEELPTTHSTDYGVAPTPEQALLSVTVTSQPADAIVEVDGYMAGRTPLDVKLSRGEYTFKVSKSGYRPWSQKIVVEAGKTQTVGVSLAEAKPSQY